MTGEANRSVNSRTQRRQTIRRPSRRKTGEFWARLVPLLKCSKAFRQLLDPRVDFLHHAHGAKFDVDRWFSAGDNVYAQL